MRLRHASPLLLLLAPRLALGQRAISVPHATDEILPANLGADEGVVEPIAGPTQPQPAVDTTKSPTASPTRPASSSRKWKGTEDAPVDGLDGKPHAGPFIDTTRDDVGSKKGAAGADNAAKPLAVSIDKYGKDIPEKIDGVMNDDNRPIPKKGTTGTEGGVTDRSKARKAQGNAMENVPQEPKEAPPLPHSEQKHIEAADLDKTRLTGTTDEVRDAVTGRPLELPSKKTSDVDQTGDFGMEKPSDLPDKPYNVPAPEPKVASQAESNPSTYSPPTTFRSGNDWLVDTMPDTEGQTGPRPPASGGHASSAAAGGEDIEWHEWFHSFVLSWTMIIVSEIGDKTFLVGALMAMRHSRLLVFTAAMAAMVPMTILSALLGHAFPSVLPRRLTTLAAAALFFVFGARSLREGLAMSPHAGVGEELREVEAELEEKEHDLARRRSQPSPYDLESARGRPGEKAALSEPSPPISRSPTPSAGGPRRRGASDPTKHGAAGFMNLLSLILSPAWAQTFVMTFLGEWGDRSQISTIAMAAGQDYWWVSLGAICGHACCTTIAVLGGRALAGRVGMRMVTIGGAVAFLVFGVISLYECLVDS